MPNGKTKIRKFQKTKRHLKTKITNYQKTQKNFENCEKTKKQKPEIKK